MMDGILSQRVTPLLKCMVLFLFIFTAKVLTSRPHDDSSHETRNSIYHQKPTHYVRTFTKYHHRRTIQWNNDQDSTYWPLTQDQPKIIEKRSVDILNSNELLDTVDEENNLNQLGSVPVKSNIISSVNEKSINVVNNDQNGVTREVRRYKLKPAVVVTEPPTTNISPNISCLYKIHSVAMSVTPSYDDERNAQLVVENEIFDTGTLSETTLPNGDTVQVEQCTDPKAFCYTLWHQDNEGNITVMGQGCWRSSQTDGTNSCDKCTRVTARLPGSKFCCCTKSFCNADFTSLKEETAVTIKAESTMESATHPNYSNIVASAILAFIAVLLMAIVFKKMYCKRMELDKDELSDGVDVEKGDIMGSGPDALATGLLCVDNLTLIEHIGQGKFGSVWRGSLAGTPVAVKLYSAPSAWHKEASVYAIPHLAHPNILRYYGSDSRAALTERGARSQLVVLELCRESLRRRLQRAPLSWREFAALAHGLAAALAHLHAPARGKPCLVHRDVNSGNVLVAPDGSARLADLGLAQPLLPRRDRAAPSRITEAGTLRYLSPEALEGALDLSGARAALCAVDVFALGLVLWEMLWRCRGAHAHVPPYAPPYHHHGLPPRPTLAQMQNLVSRNKARPPLPKGPVPEARALKIASDTCDECWDHDAEARLTAVCVEERMAELKMMLQAQGPVIHDNNLHPHPPASTEPPVPSPIETDKNSNCTVTVRNGDVTTPLLYPDPHIGRNACIERNTNTNTQTHTVELIHKSLKDITVQEQRQPNVEENCLSVARGSHSRVQTRENSDRLNEIRSYQRPLEYVPNDVSSHDIDRGPKETNILQDHREKPKWGIRKFFEKKLSKPKETEVKLDSSNTVQNAKVRTSVIEKPSNITFDRPSNLVLSDDRAYNFEGPCTLSPPNKTLSPTMIMESEMNTDKMFKELPSRDDNDRSQIFAVIVPKVIPDLNHSKTSKGSSESLKRSVRTSMSSQSIFKAGSSESEDSTIKKRLSCDNRIITNSNSGRSSRASINLELQYIDNNHETFNPESPFDLNSDCSSSEDEHLMLLSENGGSKITMQTIPRIDDKKKSDVLKEASQAKTDFGFNKYHNKYANFDNEFSDPNDKENLVNGYSGDNPVYLAALNGEINATDLKLVPTSSSEEKCPKSPKPALKSLSIKRQHSLEQVSDIFSSSSDVNLQNPAGRVKTPGDLPVAVRKARRDRALQKSRASECNRLSLYDDRMMFGNSL
ncbi:unnamed protein product [Euphydryas editha]|uniref:Serine/threonine-protein kinase receptor n=1 Tax=Euphydryas editha TaxID=104508 RepID=A0AAU9T8X3_EUPED|nr:unnamed protein product [Euphydryas editha]